MIPRCVRQSLHALETVIDVLAHRPPLRCTWTKCVNAWLGVTCQVAQHLHLVDRWIMPAYIATLRHQPRPGDPAGEAVARAWGCIPVEVVRRVEVRDDNAVDFIGEVG